LAWQDKKITVALLWKACSGKITSIDDLAAALDPDRFEVLFIYLIGNDVQTQWMAQAGRKVFWLSEDGDIDVFHPRMLFKLIRILREHHVDVLHCHNHKAGFYGAMASLLTRIPVLLAQFHGLQRSRNNRRRLANLIVFRKASRIIAVARAVQEDIIHSNWWVPRKKLLILENSVDYDRFACANASRQEARQLLGVPPDALVFGTIGRLVPTKGLPYLIDAFLAVRGRLGTAHLVLLGDGHCREELEKQARQSPYRAAFHFWGCREGVERLLRGMDIFVLSSVAEGMPRVLLEAMAAGVPCLATNVGGIPDLVEDNRTGFLVPPRDSEALAAAMLKVASLPPGDRQRIVAAARTAVQERYSHEVIRGKLGRLYESEFQAYQQRGDGHSQ
jgi:glycosyltransferase involved in cell wall biosynthesis